jgi:hypothetical protein
MNNTKGLMEIKVHTENLNCTTQIGSFKTKGACSLKEVELMIKDGAMAAGITSLIFRIPISVSFS